MIPQWIIKRIPNHENVADPKVRKAYGTFSSCVGICCNLLLFGFKYAVGMLSHSIAITSDAFNNLSDCASCLVTLFGYKLAAKPADKDHPFGHGRMEYLTSLTIAVIIALMGFELLKSSVQKIIHPETVTFHIWTLIVLIISVLLKLWMAWFNTKLGKKINSSVLSATAKDSRNDAVATSATILSLLLALVTDFPIDGIMGAAVSLFILKAGYDIIRDTVGDLLGRPADREITEKLRELILSHDMIEGIHDMMIHNYGPGKMMGSCHVEVRSDCNFVAVHEVVDQIEHEIYQQLRILMTIHMDPIELDNVQIQKYREMTEVILHNLDQRLSLHDFRLVSGENANRLIFDLVVPFDCEYSHAQLEQIIADEMRQADETCAPVITFDQDYTN